MCDKSYNACMSRSFSITSCMTRMKRADIANERFNPLDESRILCFLLYAHI